MNITCPMVHMMIEKLMEFARKLSISLKQVANRTCATEGRIIVIDSVTTECLLFRKLLLEFLRQLSCEVVSQV